MFWVMSSFPHLEKKEIEWRGYHAFRRGLATNLRALGVDDLTRRSYIKRVEAKSIEGMGKLEAELAKPKTPRAVKTDSVPPVSVA